MRRLVMLLAVLVLAPAGQVARSQNSNIKDLQAALAAIKSSSSFDRAAGLSFLAFLGQDGGGKVASKEVVGLLFDGDAEVRKWANLALPKINPEISGPVLALVQSSDYDKRLEAMQQIVKLGNAGGPSVPALLAFLKQAEPGDRVKVVNAMIGVGTKDPALGAILANLGSNDPDPKVRSAALGGLAKLDDPKSAIQAYGTMLTDADPARRATAINGLAALAAPPAKNQQALALIRGALNDASPTVRSAAKQALDRLQPKK